MEKVEIQGHVYKNIQQAAKNIGVSAQTLSYRIAKYGKNFPLIGYKGYLSPCYVNGVLVPNRQHINSQINNITGKRKNIIQPYRKTGPRPKMPPLKPDKRLEKTGRKVTVNGITYPSWGKAAKALGLDLSTVSRRAKRWGKSDPRLFMPVKDHTLHIGKHTFANITKAMKYYHTSEETIRNAVKRAKGSPKKAEEAIVWRTKFYCCGKWYHSMREAADTFNIPLGVLRSRLRYLSSNDPRLKEPEHDKIKGRPITVYGRRYVSIYAAQKDLRIKHNWLHNNVAAYGIDIGAWPVKKQLALISHSPGLQNGIKKQIENIN